MQPPELADVDLTRIIAAVRAAETAALPNLYAIARGDVDARIAAGLRADDDVEVSVLSRGPVSDLSVGIALTVWVTIGGQEWFWTADSFRGEGAGTWYQEAPLPEVSGG